MKKYLLIFIFCITTFISFSISAADNSPSYVAKIKLGFQNKDKLICDLSDYGADKGKVKGRLNISHNESDISWTSTCVISLPTTTKYCTIASHNIQNPDAFMSLYSGFQKKVLRAKVVSESDVNPGFGIYSVTYLCFE